MGLKNCWHGFGFEPTTLTLSSKSAFDFLAMATPYIVSMLGLPEPTFIIFWNQDLLGQRCLGILQIG